MNTVINFGRWLVNLAISFFMVFIPSVFFLVAFGNEATKRNMQFVTPMSGQDFVQLLLMSLPLLSLILFSFIPFSSEPKVTIGQHQYQVTRWRVAFLVGLVVLAGFRLADLAGV